MSSKTKIVVLHMKEVIYTGIFVALAVLLAVLLFIMFGTKKDSEAASSTETRFNPGVYNTSVTLNDNTFDVEVTVDADHINSISLVNLSESTTAMYPLMEPTLEEIASQIYEAQSTEDISYSEENKYTSMLLLDAINQSLEKAAVE